MQLHYGQVSGDDNTNESIGRSPSIASLPVTLEQVTVYANYYNKRTVETFVCINY